MGLGGGASGGPDMASSRREGGDFCIWLVMGWEERGGRLNYK